jgi:hypothetical protein
MNINLSRTTIGFAIVIAATMALSLPLAAGRKPRPAIAADPQKILKTFSGYTYDWSQGGAYFGKGGKFEAVWESSDGKHSVGIGKWYVTTKGSHCYEADWHGANGKQKFVKRCWEHVYDQDGLLWERSTDKKDRRKWGWYDVNIKKELTKGNKIKAQTSKLKKKYGVN